MSTFEVTRWPDPPENWPIALRDEFAANLGSGRVGTRLVSQSERVRVWLLILKAGERIGFHTHVLDYFWTAVTAGRGRSHYGDGRCAEVAYRSGDTKHMTFSKGEFMIHDLENVGDSDLAFTTVEFLDGANAPLPLPDDATGSRRLRQFT